MSYRDLQNLKHRIHTLGENIREQENFYSNINEFLHQVYQPQQKAMPEAQRVVAPARTRVFSDYR